MIENAYKERKPSAKKDSSLLPLQPIEFPTQSTRLPIVIVGNGPVGMRVVSDLFSRDRQQPVVLYGEEAHPPYDRIKLSSWLAGDADFNSFVQPYRRPFGASLLEQFGKRIISIDPKAKTVLDNCGETTHYAKLILATGSSAYIPDIPGINRDGVYMFRCIDDAIQLMARRARSHRTVVIGGGLLGLEAARGMQPMNTQVTIIDHADRLMANQLDERSGLLLKDIIKGLGFDVVVGDAIKEIEGASRVSGVRLHSGRTINCDTIVVAAGIRPHIDLAKQANLAYGRGFTVDDRMRTSDPDIYAIGECAEHLGKVYGLVAPGFEQAGVAASDITGRKSRYKGSIVASRLKVIGTDVFSVGPVGYTANPVEGKSVVFENAENGIYRKLLINRNRLTGAIGLGDWPQSLRTHTAVNRKVRVFPWQLLRFKLTGNMWPEGSGADVSSWPESVTVCQCTNTSRGRISEVITQGCNSIDTVGKACGAGTVCGSCKPLLGQLLGTTEQESATVSGVPWLTTFMMVSLIACVFIIFFPVLPYANSVQPFDVFSRTVNWHWDNLWHSTLLKQITGFSVLTSILLASTLSLRKRLVRLRSYGTFDGWRIAHLVLSAVALIGLLLHTGFRMGHGLNFYLMSIFVALSILGMATTLALGYAHKMPADFAVLIRKQSMRWHIYLVWPLPVLLGWHIFKGYWY